MFRARYLPLLFVALSVPVACGDSAAIKQNPAATEKQQEPTTFTQADIAGQWRFTLEGGVTREAEYDVNGTKLTSDDSLPSSISVSTSGAVAGAYVLSGGKGITVWTRQLRYSGQMATSKREMSGSCNEHYVNTSGTDDDTYPWAAVKIADAPIPTSGGAAGAAGSGDGIGTGSVGSGGSPTVVAGNAGGTLAQGGASSTGTLVAGSGGLSMGGASVGSGGLSLGGISFLATGGAQTGGTIAGASGGTNTGGVVTLAAGGIHATAGTTAVATGGTVASGGVQTGGVGTGGVSTGGVSTGGVMATGGAATGGAPMTLEQAAQAMAAVDCSTRNVCDPRQLELSYGNLAGCTARATQRYVWEASMPDTGTSVANFQACMAAMEKLTCAQRMAYTTVIAECRAFGNRANGSACLVGSQCSSGYCDTPEFSCGICAEVPASSAKCTTDQQCAPGQTCSSGACVTPQGSLGSCLDEAGCNYGYSCVNGICRAKATTVGAACNPAAGNPYCSAGLICETTANVCRSMPVAQPGQSCGWSNNVYTGCAYVVYCPSTNKCPAMPIPGTACNATSGPYCAWPDKCIGGFCVAPPSYASTCGQ